MSNDPNLQILTSFEALLGKIGLYADRGFYPRKLTSIDALCGRVYEVKISPAWGRAGVSPVKSMNRTLI